MDAPKRDVSWLENFPPDIWALFAVYLPGEQLGRLSMTGATFLWQRLKSPHVVKSINLGKDFMIFKSIPRFLNDFPSLESLSIDSCHDDWSLLIGLKIDSIPSGVRKLALSGFWSQSANKLFGDKVATLKLNQHLPQLQALDVVALNFANYSWMAHSPQSLTSLNLHRWDGTVALPATLIHFKGIAVRMSASSRVSTLPPSLESFDVASSLIGVELILSLLSAGCLDLHLGLWAEEPDSERHFLELLPKSLTCLTLPHSRNLKFEQFPKLISILPSTLTELKLHPELPYSAWPLLPRHLTKLSIVVSAQEDIHPEAKAIPFDDLPRTLKSLVMITSHSKHVFCASPQTVHRETVQQETVYHSYFPPSLTHLAIHRIQLSPEIAKRLPSSLTHLEIANLCEKVCQHLPDGLRTLITASTLMSPNLITFLPKRLTSLYLTVATDYHQWYDRNTGERIRAITKGEEFAIHQNCLSTWKDCSLLPPTLTHLEFFDAKELGDAFLPHQRLPNLLELRLSASKHFSDLSIPLLSSQLTTLNLQASSQISGKSFEFLPRCLTFLNLDSSESIFDCDIRHLPRTLKIAYLSKAKHLTNLCIPDLPPHLEKLSVKSSQITDACLTYLPYSLRSSQVCRSVALRRSEISWGRIEQLY